MLSNKMRFVMVSVFLLLMWTGYPVLGLGHEIQVEDIAIQEIKDITVSITEDYSLLEKADQLIDEAVIETAENSQVDLSQEIDLAGINDFLIQLDNDAREAMLGFSLTQIFNDLKQGKVDLDPVSVGKGLMGLLLKELLTCAPLIGKLLILAVLCALLQHLQLVFSGSVGKIARVMTFLVLLGIVMTIFQSAISIAVTAIDRMTGFMQAIFPVMITLLISMGSFTAAALFRPLVLGSMTFLATLLKTVIMPLFFLAAVLHLFNQLSERFQLKRLAGLLDSAGKAGLGLVLTLFIGIMTIQGVTGGVADGVVLRTAKYSADIIPVVGKYFKDAVEIVVGSGLLLRNSLGIIAVLALVVICITPSIKLIVMMLVFRISAALIEPLGEEALADSLEQIAKSLFYIFAGVASVAIMFFITIVIIVGTGNMTVMFR